MTDYEQIFSQNIEEAYFFAFSSLFDWLSTACHALLTAE